MDNSTFNGNDFRGEEVAFVSNETSKWKSRKFIFAEVLVAILAIMVIFKVDTNEIKVFFNYATAIFALYVGGNVAQKFIK